MPHITAFSDQVSSLNKGTLDVELTEAMAELVQQVRNTHKKGSINLTLTLAPLTGGEDVLKITPEIKLNLPKMPQASAIFWSTHDGDLLRNDPQQTEIEFTKIEEDPPNKVIQIDGANR